MKMAARFLAFLCLSFWSIVLLVNSSEHEEGFDPKTSCKDMSFSNVTIQSFTISFSEEFPGAKCVCLQRTFGRLTCANTTSQYCEKRNGSVEVFNLNEKVQGLYVCMQRIGEEKNKSFFCCQISEDDGMESLKVVNLTLREIHPGYVSATWEVVGKPHGYGATLFSGNKTIKHVLTKDKTYDFKDLKPGTKYTVVVDAYEDAGNKRRFSKNVTNDVTTNSTAISDDLQVRNLTIQFNDSHIILSWQKPQKPPSGVFKYKIVYCTNISSCPSFNATTEGLTIRKAENNLSKIYIAAMLLQDDNVKLKGNPLIVHPKEDQKYLEQGLLQIRNLTVDKTNEASVSLTWNTTGESDVNYGIVYCKHHSNCSSATTNKTSYEMNGLETETHYHVFVYPFTLLSSDVELRGPNTTTKIEIASLKVKNLMVLFNGTNTLISWEKPEGQNDSLPLVYKVTYCLSAGGCNVKSIFSANFSFNKAEDKLVNITVIPYGDKDSEVTLIGTALKVQPGENETDLETGLGEIKTLVHEQNATGVFLSWKSSEEKEAPNTLYGVTYCQKGNECFTLNTTEAFCFLSNLKKGTQYDVFVYAFRRLSKDVELRAQNASTSFVVIQKEEDNSTDRKIGTITFMEAVSVGSGKVNVTWNFTGDCDGFTVEYFHKDSLNETEEMNIQNPYSRNVSLSKLNWYTEYNITLRPYILLKNDTLNSRRNGDEVFRTVRTFPEAPSKVQNLTAERLTNSKEILVQWQPPEDSRGPLDGYSISYCINEFQKCNNVSTNLTNITLQNIQPQDNLTVYVHAFNLLPNKTRLSGRNKGITYQEKVMQTPVDSPDSTKSSVASPASHSSAATKAFIIFAVVILIGVAAFFIYKKREVIKTKFPYKRLETRNSILRQRLVYSKDEELESMAL